MRHVELRFYLQFANSTYFILAGFSALWSTTLVLQVYPQEGVCLQLLRGPIEYSFHFIGVQPFRRQMTHFLTDMSNRVEHQKLNQTTAELSFG